MNISVVEKQNLMLLKISDTRFDIDQVYEFKETEVKSEVPKKVREAAESMGVDIDLLLTNRQS